MEEKEKKRVVVYVDRPESIVFLPVAVDTSVRIYDDFLRLLFLHAHREASALANDIPEESGHFRFLRAACLGKINIIIRTQIGMFRPIRMDHTNCLQVAIKSIQLSKLRGQWV